MRIQIICINSQSSLENNGQHKESLNFALDSKRRYTCALILTSHYQLSSHNLVKMLIFTEGQGTCIYIKTSHKIIFPSSSFFPEFSNLHGIYIPTRQLVPFFFVLNRAEFIWKARLLIINCASFWKYLEFWKRQPWQ